MKISLPNWFFCFPNWVLICSSELTVQTGWCSFVSSAVISRLMEVWVPRHILQALSVGGSWREVCWSHGTLKLCAHQSCLGNTHSFWKQNVNRDIASIKVWFMEEQFVSYPMSHLCKVLQCASCMGWRDKPPSAPDEVQACERQLGRLMGFESISLFSGPYD